MPEEHSRSLTVLAAVRSCAPLFNNLSWLRGGVERSSYQAAPQFANHAETCRPLRERSSSRARAGGEHQTNRPIARWKVAMSIYSTFPEVHAATERRAEHPGKGAISISLGTRSPFTHVAPVCGHSRHVFAVTELNATSRRKEFRSAAWHRESLDEPARVSCQGLSWRLATERRIDSPRSNDAACLPSRVQSPLAPWAFPWRGHDRGETRPRPR
ncbi:hypothetical protein WDL1P2_00363 (plasmid) [Variovorax sp. WDL1]|nr:hypothetical protein CHC06_06477 [Variovorax sp. B2]PNG49625.1 hypothetical protein CHC07_06534 [Variovorax sp. B4]VTV18700.1 hypothetical protein WDL1P2_00363 [Variovorax sp. WDL1]